MAKFSYTETNFFLPYRLGATARDVLQEFVDIDVRAEDLTRILDKNQAYRDLCFRFVDKKTAKPAKKAKKPAKTNENAATPNPAEEEKKAEPPSPTYRLIHLLGMLGSRNLILSLRLLRIANGKFPITEEGEIDLSAADIIKRAMQAEEVFQRNNLEYSETAYAAAVYFDLAKLLHASHPSWKDLEPYFNSTWDRAFRTGLIAYFLAEKLTGFSQKHALAAGIFAHAGKLPLAGKFATEKEPYHEFETKLNQCKELTPIARLLLEREAFGTTEEEAGAHILRYFGLFPDLIPVVRYFREPYCLKGRDPGNYRFALLIWLADCMAHSWKIPADEKDSVFLEWSCPGLAALKLKKATLIEVMKRAMTLK